MQFKDYIVDSVEEIDTQIAELNARLEEARTLELGRRVEVLMNEIESLESIRAPVSKGYDHWDTAWMEILFDDLALVQVPFNLDDAEVEIPARCLKEIRQAKDSGLFESFHGVFAGEEQDAPEPIHSILVNCTYYVFGIRDGRDFYVTSWHEDDARYASVPKYEEAEGVSQEDEVKPAAFNERELYDCFLSYSKHDKAIAHQIANKLTERGYRVWIDDNKTLSGDSLPTEIESALGRSAHFTCVLSSSYAESRWCQLERDAALMLYTTRRTRIIPVKTADCDVPALLGAFKWADFTKDFADGMNDLISGIGKK